MANIGISVGNVKIKRAKKHCEKFCKNSAKIIQFSFSNHFWAMVIFGGGEVYHFLLLFFWIMVVVRVLRSPPAAEYALVNYQF